LLIHHWTRLSRDNRLVIQSEAMTHLVLDQILTIDLQRASEVLGSRVPVHIIDIDSHRIQASVRDTETFEGKGIAKELVHGVPRRQGDNHIRCMGLPTSLELIRVIDDPFVSEPFVCHG